MKSARCLKFNYVYEIKLEKKNSGLMLKVTAKVIFFRYRLRTSVLNLYVLNRGNLNILNITIILNVRA